MIVLFKIIGISWLVLCTIISVLLIYRIIFYKDKIMSYEEWFLKEEESIMDYLSESGASYGLDNCEEEELRDRYNDYLDSRR